MKCNTENIQEQEINHLETLRFLKRQGYPLMIVRRVMPKLIGIDQKWIAMMLGGDKHYIAVRQTMSMAKYRRQKSLQEEICKVLGLPVEEFFEEEKAQEAEQGKA